MEDRGHDPWRRDLEHLNDGRYTARLYRRIKAVGRSLRVVKGRGGVASARTGRLTFLSVLGALTLATIGIFALLAVVPLAWERRAPACSALESLATRQAQGWRPQGSATNPALVLMPSSDLPNWLRCYVAYWRRLGVPSNIGPDWRRITGPMDTTVAAYLIGAGVVVGSLAGWALMRRRRSRGGGDDAFSVLGTDAKTVMARTAPPPVDLSKPITGDAAWRALRAHATDAAYRRAVETVRLRYQLVSNPMLLPNTLREVMDRTGLSFREAMLRVAEDDGVGIAR